MEETSYLNSPPLTPEQIERIYGSDADAEERELTLGKAALKEFRKMRTGR